MMMRMRMRMNDDEDDDPFIEWEQLWNHDEKKLIICLNVETYGKTTRGRMMNKYDDPLTILIIQDAPFSEETK